MTNVRASIWVVGLGSVVGLLVVVYVVMRGGTPEAPTTRMEPDAQSPAVEDDGASSRILNPKKTRRSKPNEDPAEAMEARIERAKKRDAYFAANIDTIVDWDLARLEEELGRRGYGDDDVGPLLHLLMMPENWARGCRLSRELMRDDPAFARTYAEAPRPLPALPVWVLELPALRVPIPAQTWSRLIVSQNRGSRLVVILVGDEPKRSLLFGRGPEIEADLGAGSQRGMDRAMTEAYGKKLSMSEVTIKGLETTPDELECPEAGSKIELARAWAMDLKTIDDSSDVYRVGEHPGWVWQRTRPGQHLWDARIQPIELDDEITVYYSIPAPSPYEKVGLYIDRVGVDSAPERPDWLTPLGKAIAVNTADGWARFEATLVAQETTLDFEIQP